MAKLNNTIAMGVEVHRCDKCERRQNTAWIDGTILPPDMEHVLVWFEYYRYGNYNRLYQTMGISYAFNGEWSGFVNGSSGWRDLKIISWQPLPAPPTRAKGVDE